MGIFMSVIGLRVGPFEIVEPVWVPEPGRWFRARAVGPEAQGDVLVRLLSDGSPDERVEVRHQYEVLRRISDPHVPAAVRFDDVSGALVLRGEVGAPLTDAIALRRDETVVMTPATLLDLLLELASALAAAHASGHVHGHLDSDCVVLDTDGKVWLYGLGVRGVPPDEWLAPEQSSGDDATALTDQWALGALAIGLVLGHGVWQDDVLLQTTDDLARAVRAVADQWPALGRVLGRMVDPVPAGRFPSLADARHELVGLARLAGPHSDRSEIGQLLCTRRKLRPPPRLLAGAGAPTAVPSTDAASDPSDGTWFARRSSPDADADIEISPGLPAGRTVVPADELSLGSDRPALVRTGVDSTIVKLAPVFAGIMLVLLVVWLIVNVIW
jgi:serine/threonine protein kinase